MGFPVTTRTLGEFITPTIWNADLAANMNAMGPHLLARKSGDQSVTSSTVLVNDSDLLHVVGASETWMYWWHLIYDAATASDIKLAFTFPSGRIDFSSTFVDESGTATFRRWNTATSPATALGLYGPGGPINYSMAGVFANGATPGNLQLQWAQNTSGGTATIMKINSTLWGVQLA